MHQQNNTKAAAASNSGIVSRPVAPVAPVAELKPFPTSYPGGITPDTLFDKRTERIIAAQADKMIVTGLFEQFERDDVANELRIILAHEMTNYDPTKDRYTFTATVLAKRGLNEVVRRAAWLRDNPRPESLDRPINGQSGMTFADALSADDHASFWNNTRRPLWQERLLEKIGAFLDTLGPTDRAICQMLMDGASIRETAVRMGMSHTGIRYHLSKLIAPIARKCGCEAGKEETGA